MANNLENEPIDLKDPKTLEKFEHFIGIIQVNDLHGQAWELSNVILALLSQNPNFAEKEPEFFKRYQSILIRSRWLGLPLLTDTEVAEMFEKYLIEGLALRPEIDLWQKLKLALMGHQVYENRNKLKEDVRKALTRNKQLITKNSLIISNTKRDSTIGNWIIDFTANLGDGISDQVKVNQYFVSGINTKNLEKGEKENLRILLDIYRRLRLSSLTTVGIEESIPFDGESKTGTIREGRFEEIKPSEYQKILKEIQNIRQNQFGPAPASLTNEDLEKRQAKLMQEFLGPEEERARIHKEENSLEAVAKGDLAPIRQVFLEALNQKDHYKAVAALRILAQKGNLVDELIGDVKISEMFKNLLKENYKLEILADFQRQGFTAPYFSLFLQRVLKNQLGLSEADSARMGIQLENIMAKKGESKVGRMVFGDLVKGEYQWQEIRDEGVRLSLPEEVK